MLKGIDRLLSPEMLKVLCEMGLGDRIVIADGNFPAESLGKNGIVVRMDGHGACEVLKAILSVFPLDTMTDKPVLLMEAEPDEVIPIWEDYREIISREDNRGAETIGHLERYAFYDAARHAYAIVATGESALSANIILQKGVV